MKKIATLNNGMQMPMLGLGTASFSNEESMAYALTKVGYRHIDTAMIYNNEEVVGRAIKTALNSGITRQELFVTTKLWHSEYDDPKAALKKSLNKLQLDYVDLYLVHWPMSYFAKKPLHKLWPEMEELVDSGLCKSIGVSNFNTQLMWDLLSYCRIKPVVNQVELNPQCSQPELVKFLLAQDILPVAYTPIARPGGQHKEYNSMCPSDWPDIRENQILKDLAKKYNKSVVQIMLNWGLARGYAVIPMASQPQNQQANTEVFDFQLTPEETLSIDTLNSGLRLCNKFDMTHKFDCFA